MSNTLCPHCGQMSIPLLDRLKAGKWLTIACPACGGRLCMQPIVLAVAYFLHTWNFAFFGFLAVYESSLIYLGVMIVLWLIMEFFSYYIPLSRMRPKKPAG